MSRPNFRIRIGDLSKNIKIARNPSYIRSVLTGIGYPILHLPQILFSEWLKPVVFLLFAAVMGTVYAVGYWLILIPIAGIFGFVSLQSSTSGDNLEERRG